MSETKTVTIPSSVTTIPEDAFYWSKAVDDIYLTVADTANLTWALPYSADAQFKPSKATLCHVPADLLTAYQEKFGTLNMTFVGDLDPITPLTPLFLRRLFILRHARMPSTLPVRHTKR